MLQEEELTQEQVPAETKPPRPTLREKLLAREGVIAYLPIIVVVILMFMGASWQFIWLHTDAARYQCYSLTFWLGGGASRLLPGVQCAYLPHSSLIAPPFHALPLEYPPLTLLIFTPALLAPLVYYQMAFAILMALMAVFIYWLLLRYAPRGAGLAFAAYMLIGAWATAEARFDLVPAALTLICVIAANRKHWTFAYIALAIAFLLKIYPLLFLPALFIAEQQDARRFTTPQQPVTLASLPAEIWRTLRGFRQWRWKNTLIFFAILFGVTGFFALLDFRGAVLSQLSYFANRPVQVEATASPILFLAAHFGVAGHTAYTFGSINIISPLGEPVSLVFDVAAGSRLPLHHLPAMARQAGNYAGIHRYPARLHCNRQSVQPTVPHVADSTAGLYRCLYPFLADNLGPDVAAHHHHLPLLIYAHTEWHTRSLPARLHPERGRPRCYSGIPHAGLPF